MRPSKKRKSKAKKNGGGAATGNGGGMKTTNASAGQKVKENAGGSRAQGRGESKGYLKDVASDTCGSGGSFENEEMKTKDTTKMSRGDRKAYGRGRGTGRGSSVSSSTLSEKARRERIMASKWDLLPDILNVRGLVKQHIISFDHFLKHGLQRVIDANSEVVSDQNSSFSIKYKKIRVGKPCVVIKSYETEDITPMMCRIRDMTYAAPIEVDVEYSFNGDVREQKASLGRIPIMLRSSKCVLRGKTARQLAQMQECPHDPGGYFVVRGFEKVILMQEQLKNNRIFIDVDDKNALRAGVVSSTNVNKTRTQVIQKSGKFYVENNKFTHEVPLVIMMKAMGVSSDQEIVSLIGATSEIARRLALSIQEASALGVSTHRQALHFVGGLVRPSSYTARRKRPRVDEARNALNSVVLVHVAADEHHSLRDKSIFLALMVNRIIVAEADPRMISDKDFYGNKRIALAGDLMQLLFEDLFKGLNQDIKKTVDKVLTKPIRASPFQFTNQIKIYSHRITSGFNKALSTGNWQLKRFRMDQKGVTETVTRLSYISALGNLTRVRSNVEKSRKVSGPRALQASQWGMVCPADTPEGEQCGLVKALALLAHITKSDEDDGVKVQRLLLNCGVEPVGSLNGESMHREDAYLVLLNGRIVGATNRALDLLRALKKLRRRGRIDQFVSFYIHKLERTVNVSTDGGRVCRPLQIVCPRTRRPILTQRHLQELVEGLRDFHSLVREGCIEYVDVNEENACVIALAEDKITPRTTHVEIDPVTIMGIVSALIPFPHHNQSPRNTYQCAMGKQAIGSVGYNQNERCNLTVMNTLVYPHKPMVRSRVLDFVNFDKLGGGQNAMVAVMSYSGYDIEDALIVNKASLDRGYGRANIVKRYTAALEKKDYGAARDRVKPHDMTRPPHQNIDVWERRNAKYRSLGADGLAEVGVKVNEGSVIINKFVPEQVDGLNHSMRTGGASSDKILERAQPTYFKEPGPRTVQRVVVAASRDNRTVCKVLIRDFRTPEIGDKYSSRHGQKGVIGLIVPQENLPFTESGVCPDMIMNPHGFPSRMTVGKMIELVDGKAGLLDGRRRFGTAFGGDSVVECGKVLMERGLSYSGKELLYSGLTGDVFEAYIFFGPIYYQRLKHMVKDKMFARSRGPHVTLTRQPTQGRSRQGGLRVGEMERDCLVAHGVSLLLIERMLLSSDPFTASVCSKCGLLAYSGYCQYCKSGSSVSDFRIPYACKLLFQELMSMNVQPRIRLSEGGYFEKGMPVDSGSGGWRKKNRNRKDGRGFHRK